MSDHDFLAAFESAAIPSESWTHREHLRVAFLYLRDLRFDEALVRLRSGIRALNRANGVTDTPISGYHETVTVAWARLVATAIAPDRAPDFETFAQSNPALLAKDRLRAHYSKGRLMAPEARASFVEPDIAPLPQVIERRGDLQIALLLPADAEGIARWRYSGDYAFYNPSAERETYAPSYMLDPSNRFYSVRRESRLIGFCCLGAEARVPGGIYDVDALDVGAGMDPALVGRGHGRMFLGAIVEHAGSRPGTHALRVTIASWNERALRAAQSVGFCRLSTFTSTHGVDFTILVR